MHDVDTLTKCGTTMSTIAAEPDVVAVALVTQYVRTLLMPYTLGCSGDDGLSPNVTMLMELPSTMSCDAGKKPAVDEFGSSAPTPCSASGTGVPHPAQSGIPGGVPV